jgi:hypothetical protein
MTGDQLDGQMSLRAWVRLHGLALLLEGKSKPEVLDYLQGELPQKYVSESTRPALKAHLDAVAKDQLIANPSPKVNEAAPMVQLVLFSLDQILDYARKGLAMEGNQRKALLRKLDAWCAAHPEAQMTPALLVERAAS